MKECIARARVVVAEMTDKSEWTRKRHIASARLGVPLKKNYRATIYTFPSTKLL
jgi:hypothetical protein